jgi:hypothetical protein
MLITPRDFFSPSCWLPWEGVILGIYSFEFDVYFLAQIKNTWTGRYNQRRVQVEIVDDEMLSRVKGLSPASDASLITAQKRGRSTRREECGSQAGPYRRGWRGENGSRESHKSHRKALGTIIKVVFYLWCVLWGFIVLRGLLRTGGA